MHRFIVLLAAFIFLGAGCAMPPVAEQKSDITSLTFSTYDGERISLNEYKGKPLIVNSWATWCPFCKKELPDFADVQEVFGDDIMVIAIGRAESLAIAKGFTDAEGLTDRMHFWLDPEDSFYRAIGGFSMPETLFIRADGSVDFHKRGFMTKEEITERINALLE